MNTKIDKIAKIHITRSDTNTGIDSPVGIITPKFIGQEYICGNGTTKKIFKARGLENTDWLELGEVPEIDLSNLATKTELNGVSAKLGTMNEQVENNKSTLGTMNEQVENNKSTIATHTNEINSIKQQLGQNIILISEDLTVIEERLG